MHLSDTMHSELFFERCIILSSYVILRLDCYVLVIFLDTMNHDYVVIFMLNEMDYFLT